MSCESETLVANNLEFRPTCFGAPEQYDVYSRAEQVGYVRLRGGLLRVDFPVCGGRTVLEHSFDDDWKPCFDDDEERQLWLYKAAIALLDAMNRRRATT